ncbi:MAG: hypothetical protein WD267_00725 [Balneolales bacterium]
MIIFRNHSLRLIGIMLLLIGLTPGLIPTKANFASAESVSKWLIGFAGENTSDQAWIKISQLETLQEEPSLLLKKASKMISENPDLFAIPVNNPEPTDEEVFNVLINEWNRQQQTGSMGTAFISERQSLGLPFGSINDIEAGFTLTIPPQTQNTSLRFSAYAAVSSNIIPLVGGTSINAP